MGNIIGVLFQPFTFVTHQFITMIYATFVDKLWRNFNRQRLEDNSTFSLENQQKRLKGFLLICLEQDFYKHNQIKTSIEHLEAIVPDGLSLNDSDQCEQWLMQYNNGKQIVLIISNTFGKQIIPHIHHLSSIKAIYICRIYRIARKNSNQWTKKYSKVHGNMYDFNKLTQQVLKDLEYITVAENQRFSYSPYMLTKSTQTVHKQESFEQHNEIQKGMYWYLKQIITML
jgi:hypothetical protein